ncbi:MAG: metal-sensitive transcriptional regulator [Actinobacteria bacterium]|nr:metal-sensitive transcriptional regulator [Actinomycetota bacterium]
MKSKSGEKQQSSSCPAINGEDSSPGDVSANKRYFQGEMLNRLKKIEGQVRGVHKMIQEGRSCGDIVIQLAAIKAAVNRVGTTVLACHLADQIEEALREERDVRESLEEFMTIFKKFS